MRERIGIGAAAALTLVVLLPAASARSATPQPRAVASAACRAEQSQGARAFRQRYGKRAMRKCVKRTMRSARESIQTGVADCNEELAEDGAAGFIDGYGTTGDLNEALDACVNYSVEIDFEDVGLDLTGDAGDLTDEA